MTRLPALLVLALGLMIAEPITARNTVVWEPVPDRPVSSESRLSQQEDVEVTVHNGSVYITVDHPVKVEVFSILGQLITQRQVEGGTIRLTLGQRGIFILKAGSTAKRINL